MQKKYKKQKVKTPINYLIKVVSKILILITIIFLLFVFLDKAGFSTSSITFSSKKDNTSSREKIPLKLKWFDDFKGVENVPSKHQKEKHSGNKFLNF